MSLVAAEQNASRTTADKRPATASEPPHRPAGGAVKTHQKSHSESPCFPRPKSPHGVRGSERVRVLGDRFRPSDEQVQKARQWLVEELVEQSMEMMKDGNRNQ